MAYRISYRRDSGSAIGPIGFLVILNLLMWIATSIRPSLFIGLFGFTPLYAFSQPWTVLTAMFIHTPFPGFYHILGNMVSLYFLGTFLTNLIGDKRFLIVYFLGGIAGNLLFFLVSTMMGQPYVTAIGASGAVSAVCGTLVALRPKMRVYMMFIPIPMPLWAFALIFLVILSIIVPGIAWEAHLGGLVFGLILGYFFRRRLRRLFMG